MFPRSPVPVLIFAVTTSSAPVFCQVHQDHLSYVGILGSAGREGFEDRLGLHTTRFPTTFPHFWTSQEVPWQLRR